MKYLIQIFLKVVIVGFLDLNRPKEDYQITFKKNIGLPRVLIFPRMESRCTSATILFNKVKKSKQLI